MTRKDAQNLGRFRTIRALRGNLAEFVGALMEMAYDNAETFADFDPKEFNAAALTLSRLVERMENLDSARLERQIALARANGAGDDGEFTVPLSIPERVAEIQSFANRIKAHSAGRGRR